MSNVTQIMSEYKFIKDYAQWVESKNRYETWEEAVERVINMHKLKYKNILNDSKELNEFINFAEEAYKEKLVLASQRSLQFGGEPTLKKEERMFNCLTSYCDRIAFFQEAMHWLLCGGGIGFSVQKHHINKLPELHQRNKGVKTFIIEDSIEGWSDAFGVLISSYCANGSTFKEYEGCRVDFDYSLIRPEGSLISGGYKAPGADGLRASIIKAENILDNIVKNGKGKFRPIECYDIVMHMSDAVLSGGVRRSATICVFSKDDNEMMTAKTGDWFIKNPQRGRSNNSVLLVRNTTTKKEFLNIFESVKQFGEPGIVWAENEDVLYNPCVEIGFIPVSPSNESAWQGCVSYNTKLITKDGITNIGAASESGSQIEIWNGEEWSTVKPIMTGRNRDLYRVEFGDGSYLDATDNHKFLVKNRFQKEFQEVVTKDLIELLKDTKYTLSVPRSNIKYDGGYTETDAYNYGYILGDGTVHKRHNGTIRKPSAEVYEHEFKLLEVLGRGNKISDKVYKGKGTLDYKTVTFESVDPQFSFDLKYSEGIPSQVFSWDRKSILNFISGWIDSDGTKTANGFRVYGREDKIRDLQLLMSKIGINSSVNLMQKKGSITNYGVRKNDVWYIQVCEVKDIICNKFEMPRSKEVLGKGKYQTIRSITKLEGNHDSYCFEEQKLHQGVFNNVLTKQCNLTEINGGKTNNKESFFRAIKAATILGTLQAGYTNFKYSTQATKETFEKESLLGVSITGWMENPKFLFDKNTLKDGAEYAKEINKQVSKLLGINQAARVTCTKPSGNASVLLGTSSGIHPHHSPRYFRNVQGNKEEDVVKAFAETNPQAVEESVWSANGKDLVLSFPITAPRGSLFKDQLSGIELLDYVKLAQNSWVEYGTNVELCNHPKLRHNISNTITVTDWDATADYVYENRDYFAGISFLPPSGDKDYAQAPFTEVKTPEDILEKYGTASMLASGLVVDGLHAFNNNLWEACDTVLGRGIDLSSKDSNNVLQIDWVRRVKKFSKRYFKNDLVETTYCLKDIHILHKWETITRSFKPIDWDAADIKPKYTEVNTLGALSCNGGACDIVF